MVDYVSPPLQPIRRVLGHSFYNGGTTPPNWMSSVALINPDEDALRLTVPEPGSTVPQSPHINSGWFSNPPPWTGTGDFHLMNPAPDLGDGFTIGVDLAHFPAGGRLSMWVLGGQTVATQFVNVLIEGGQVSFNWAGEVLIPDSTPYADLIDDIYEGGSVIGLGASQRYLRLCFDGSSGEVDHDYWALQMGDTLSGMGTPTGAIANSELHILRDIPGAFFQYDRPQLFGPARTLRPVNLRQFICQVEVSGADGDFFDLFYWDIGGQDVHIPFARPWAVAVDGDWHGTYNLAAGSYYDAGLDQLVFDWSSTYPQRLGS